MDDTPITDSERRALRAMVAVGCDRETAAKALGWTREQINEALQNDADFAREVLQAEGQAEFHHMRILHNAAKDEKHWRAATWWLEHRAKKDDGRVSLLQAIAAQLDEFVEQLVKIVQVEVKADEDRKRLLARLQELSRDEQPVTESLPAMDRDSGDLTREEESEKINDEPRA